MPAAPMSSSAACVVTAVAPDDSVTADPLSVNVAHDQVSALPPGSTNTFKLNLLVGQMEVPVAGELTITRPNQ